MQIITHEYTPCTDTLSLICGPSPFLSRSLSLMVQHANVLPSTRPGGE